MINGTLSFFGLIIHWYGLILGLAIVIGVWLTEKKAFTYQISSQLWWRLTITALIGGVLGARLYHLVTDWQLYQNNILQVFYIWQGGLSIIGAVLGGAIAVKVFIWLMNYRQKKIQHKKIIDQHKNISYKKVLDLSVFGLPFAQAIGRWGNFVNQELYGQPTNWPWGIYIMPLNRLPWFENWSYFQPLFLYESLLMLFFGLFIWWLDKKIRLKKVPIFLGRFSGLQVGSGSWFIFYIFYYSIIRFFLDFIRIDKAQFFNIGLGKNQVFLLIVIVVLMMQILIKSKKVLRLMIVGVLFFLSITFLLSQQFIKSTQRILQYFQSTSSTQSILSTQSTLFTQSFQQLNDHQIITATLGDSPTLFLEVVKTAQSISQGLGKRDQIGADGMLFIFQQSIIPSFWMKDMRFDLDLIWLSNGQVVEITANVPHSGTADQQLPLYRPTTAVDMVLEVAAGQASLWGVKLQDSLQFSNTLTN